jgi:bacillithiol system protein YtxJ
VIPLADEPTLERAAAEPVAVIYKHSTRCASSRMAEEEVGRFAGRHPDVPVYRVDVVRDRRLARRIAERLGVTHASPQAIVLRRGRVVWAGSHGEVDADRLVEQIRAPAGA